MVSPESVEVVSEPVTTIGGDAMTIRDQLIVAWWLLMT
jgi:hypothetical protein